MAGTPDMAEQFLSQLRTRVHSSAHREYEMFLAEKQTTTSGTANQVSTLEIVLVFFFPATKFCFWIFFFFEFKYIFKWDEFYYANKIKATKLGQDYKQVDGEMQEYLSLENCLEGLNTVSKKVGETY